MKKCLQPNRLVVQLTTLNNPLPVAVSIDYSFLIYSVVVLTLRFTSKAV